MAPIAAMGAGARHPEAWVFVVWPQNLDQKLTIFTANRVAA
eukprot:CAMPEP_0206265224 /NCGR_PEP_ID=MMETSP0047_2-20121206/29865_1 /ASSEMBLY_ACC=CAM_ASM_000192 /TAXON_ID=195065 /ORGANISM="Chroomonas mesostigmatica_cf, Strain CCMP1168" /LENGTH=40 /DNA_ID= /DNA_START= /DNA_END= /DNA_ORIENTATION=